MPNQRNMLLKTFALSTGHNVHHVSADGSILYSWPPVSPEANPLCTDPSLTKELLDFYRLEPSRKNLPLFKMTSCTISFAAVPCKEDDNSIYVIGPSLALSAFISSPKDMAESLSIINAVEFNAYIHSASRLEWAQFSASAAHLYYLEHGILLPLSSVLQNVLYSPVPNYDFHRTASDFIFERNENAVPDFSAEAQQRLLYLVSQGNARAATRYLKYLMTEQSQSQNPLNAATYEEARDIFISIVALMSACATLAGVDHGIALQICFKNIHLAVECKTIKEINNYWGLALAEFSKEIFSVNPEQTYTTKLCCDYIHTHLHMPISIHDLSELTHINPRTLSKQLKTDLGIPIKDYIMREKIKEAKDLLKFRDYKLAEISNLLDFSSQSYFTTVFTKVVGVSPQVYRSRYVDSSD